MFAGSYIVTSIPIKYQKFPNRSIWAIDEKITGITTPSQWGPRSNSNEEMTLADTSKRKQ